MMKQEIPIFFAVDDDYIPFLAVAIQSLSEKVNNENLYMIRILYTDINEENKSKIMLYENDNIKIEFVNVRKNLEKLKNKLLTRDYYSNATYYRVLIPNLYPEYKKVIYLDADIVVLDDLAMLYYINMKLYLIAGVAEAWFKKYKEFQDYATKVIGLSNYKRYINAGVMVMNLEELRNINFENIFLHLLETVKYTADQDQGYFNRICKGRIKYLKEYWNAGGYLYKKHNPKIIHYTVFKPWQVKDMPNKEYFWDIAKKTAFYDYILSLITEDSNLKGEQSLAEFRRLMKYESSCVGNG